MPIAASSREVAHDPDREGGGLDRRQEGRRALRRGDEVGRREPGAQARARSCSATPETEYGREHGFASIGSLADYASAVPVVTYEDIAERVKRMANGESNVLTAEDPVMFARTSGTTGEPKLIPVTPTCRGRDHADQMRTWLYHAQKDHPGIFAAR